MNSVRMLRAAMKSSSNRVVKKALMEVVPNYRSLEEFKNSY